MANKWDQDALVVEDSSGEKYNSLFRALADERRRRALSYVLDADSSVTIDELATGLAEWESEMTVLGEFDGDIGELRAVLQHIHLPKLAEADLIEYDTSAGTIETAKYAEDASAQLEAMNE